MNIIELDTINNVAFTDEGDMLPIEDYCDEDEIPCLHEEAKYVFIRSGSNSYHRVEILKEE